MNRLNGGVPTNDQLLSAAASLINADQILGSNPSLANYQTLSRFINNSSNLNAGNPGLAGGLLGKPTGSLPVASLLGNLPSSPAIAPVNERVSSMNVANLMNGVNSMNGPNSMNGVNSMNGLNSINAMNGVPNIASNLPLNALSSLPTLSNLPTFQGLPGILNNRPSLTSIVSNGLPMASPSQPPALTSQPMHASNRNMINVLNNANKAFDLAGDETPVAANGTSGLTGGEPTPNYLTFNGENAMPEHWRLLISGMQKFSLNLIKSLHNFEPRDTSTGIILSPFSIWSTLIVTYMGAKGETERESMLISLYKRERPFSKRPLPLERI